MAININTLGFVKNKTFEDIVKDGFSEIDDGEGFEYIVGEFKGGEIKVVYEPSGTHDVCCIDGVNGFAYALCFEDEKLAKGQIKKRQAGFIAPDDDAVLTVGLIIIVLFVAIGWFSASDDTAEDLVTQCEQNLPRNETCQLIAVPIKRGASDE